MAEGFGMARAKPEGAPAHPEDVYEHCGCEKCEARWVQQLRAYVQYLREHGMEWNIDAADLKRIGEEPHG